MTIVKVELLDDQAAALEAKAAAQGWSLGDWFRFIADQEVRPRKGRYNLAELIQRCDPTAELSDEDREWVGLVHRLKTGTKSQASTAAGLQSE